MAARVTKSGVAAKIAKTAEDRKDMTYGELVKRYHELDALVSELNVKKHLAFAEVSRSNQAKPKVLEHRRIDHALADARRRKGVVMHEMQARLDKELKERGTPPSSDGDATAHADTITIGSR